MGELPLDDPRWCPMQAAIELRWRQTGATRLAIADLEQYMASGRLRCMRRDLASGKRERVSAAFWATYQGRWIGSRRITIYRRGEAGHVDDWMFYVWRPDFDSLYSDSARVDHDDDSKQPSLPIDRAKAVLRDLYPAKAQMPGSLKAAARDVVEECRKRGWKPMSPDTIQRAAEELGYRPPRKRR